MFNFNEVTREGGVKRTTCILLAVLCAGVAAAQTQPLPDYVPQTCEYVARTEGDFVYYTRSGGATGEVAEVEPNVIEGMGEIRPDETDRQKVLELFGPPPEIMVRVNVGPQHAEHLTYNYGS